MLQAINQDGQVVAIWSVDRQEIEQMRSMTFYCPACKQPLIIKAGSKKSPHFAHRVDKGCALSGESSYHDEGKKDIYVWLKRQGYKVYLEHHIAEINQRPDILLEIANKRIAIEYQCAAISQQEMLKRTAGYRSVQIHPIWILGGNRLKRQSADTLHVSIADQVFLSQIHPVYPLALYYYCSASKQIASFQDIIFVTRRTAFGNLTFKKLSGLTWQELFQPHYRSKSLFQRFWRRKKEKWRYQPASPYHQQEQVWRQWLYLNQLQITDFPSYVYLPITSQYQMKSAPWIWQSRLYVDLFLQRQQFFRSEAEHILHDHYLPLEQFPLINNKTNPIDEYLQLLIRFQVIKKITSNQYQVNHSTV
ncbi:competence protein CoiA [Gracilibacillus alcaliphilus]|uniref:competence protein CoiA n=1 Tax=Gracilibacillus alcaliphilus TaxID=1401441 RepID=UPI00195ABDED|nr:competence protein CoiA family protein [Gracilibacillus alcaliphilus]MBM7675469.1 competence CoiA-like predicted nuclease [Gracilibacillus alcaliphilus]